MTPTRTTGREPGPGRRTPRADPGHRPRTRSPGHTGRSNRRDRPEHRDRGAAAVELALLTPLLILLLLFLVSCGRLVQTRLRLVDASHAAARAASLARDPATARAAAEATAHAALAPTGTTCAALSVSTDTTRFTRGGQVSVTLTCRTDLDDLAGLSLPGTSTQEVSATSPIDTYRSVTETP